MTPTQAISMLDRQLAANGEDVLLVRPLARGQAKVSVTVRAQAQGYLPHELIAGSGIMQGDTKVIISPTQIDAAQWPGAGTPVPGGLDPRIPTKGDNLIIGGRQLAVQSPAAVRRIAGEIVRMEIQARG